VAASTLVTVVPSQHAERRHQDALGLVLLDTLTIPAISRNPSKDVPLYEDPNKKERFLTQGETSVLFEAVRRSDNVMLEYIIPMLLLTGARKREVLDAKWEDFDLQRKQWRIPETKLGRPVTCRCRMGCSGLGAFHNDALAFATQKKNLMFLFLVHGYGKACGITGCPHS
jgi:integrase